jgi:cytochrome c-type biogenesis protein CcmH
MNQVRVVLLLLAAVPLLGSYGKGNARLERLYSTFMSPCCWQQNLTLHDSPIARELRAEIQRMVASGRSDQEIKADLVRRYSKRMLALPDGPERLWLIATPWLLSAAGLFGVALFVRRLRAEGPSAGPSRDLVEFDADWDADSP